MCDLAVNMFFQVFDVRLNGHVVVKDLDIFERVGHSTAHDEIVSFSIRRGKLSVQAEVSTFNGKLTVEFVKVSCFYLNYLRYFLGPLSVKRECQQVAYFTSTLVRSIWTTSFVLIQFKQVGEVEQERII